MILNLLLYKNIFMIFIRITVSLVARGMEKSIAQGEYKGNTLNLKRFLLINISKRRKMHNTK